MNNEITNKEVLDQGLELLKVAMDYLKEAEDVVAEFKKLDLPGRHKRYSSIMSTQVEDAKAWASYVKAKMEMDLNK